MGLFDRITSFVEDNATDVAMGFIGQLNTLDAEQRKLNDENADTAKKAAAEKKKAKQVSQIETVAVGRERNHYRFLAASSSAHHKSFRPYTHGRGCCSSSLCRKSTGAKPCGEGCAQHFQEERLPGIHSIFFRAEIPRTEKRR